MSGNEVGRMTEAIHPGRVRAPAVFLDRDGVINEVVYRDGQPGSPRDLTEFRFTHQVHETLSELACGGYRLFVVSNQPDVARGLLSPEILQSMTDRIRAELPVDDVLICPHDDADACECRKPKPGLIDRVAPDLDISRSFLIGDSWKDIEAARRGGVKAILLSRDYNSGVSAEITARDLRAATTLILAERVEERLA